VLTSRCQRSGVVERTACTSANQVVNEHLLLSDPLPEEDRNSYLSYKCFLTALFLSPQSYPTTRMPGHFLPDVCAEIHPLLWRLETFRLAHRLFISNLADMAQRRGTRNLRTNQSGINEEHVSRGRDRGNRTHDSLILEKYINTRPEPTGVDLALTNVDPLCFPLRKTLSQDATRPSENYPSGKSASATRPKETRVWYLCFGMAQCREPYP
jgi:hypothetical protein